MTLRREDAGRHVAELRHVLEARGFEVSVRASTGDLLSARNRSLEASPDNPPGRFIADLVQTVVCRLQGDDLWWLWVWAAREDDVPEYEPLCPASEIVTAADRIAHVLAFHEEPGS
jgi:hypothetical protein